MTYFGLPILTRFLIEPIPLWVSCGGKINAAVLPPQRVRSPYLGPSPFQKRSHARIYLTEGCPFHQRGLKNYCNVTKTLQELGLKDLKDHRRDLRLALLFQVVQGHVGMSPEDIGLVPADGRTRGNHKHKFRIREARTTEMAATLSRGRWDEYML